MTKIYERTWQLAIDMQNEAKLLDEAFLKHADPRAVQGGATCFKADELRSAARAVRNIAVDLEHIY